MLKNLREILSGGVDQALLRLWSPQLSEPEAATIRSRAKADRTTTITNGRWRLKRLINDGWRLAGWPSLT